MTTDYAITRTRADVRRLVRQYRAFGKFSAWYCGEIRAFWHVYRAAWRRYLKEIRR